MSVAWASVHPLSLRSSPVCSGFKLIWDRHSLVQGWISPATQVLQLSRAFIDLAPSSSASVPVQHPAAVGQAMGNLGVRIEVMVRRFIQLAVDQPVPEPVWSWAPRRVSLLGCSALPIHLK